MHPVSVSYWYILGGGVSDQIYQAVSGSGAICPGMPGKAQWVMMTVHVSEGIGLWWKGWVHHIKMMGPAVQGHWVRCADFGQHVPVSRLDRCQGGGAGLALCSQKGWVKLGTLLLKGSQLGVPFTEWQDHPATLLWKRLGRPGALFKPSGPQRCTVQAN